MEVCGEEWSIWCWLELLVYLSKFDVLTSHDNFCGSSFAQFSDKFYSHGGVRIRYQNAFSIQPDDVLTGFATSQASNQGHDGHTNDDHHQNGNGPDRAVFHFRSLGSGWPMQRRRMLRLFRLAAAAASATCLKETWLDIVTKTADHDQLRAAASKSPEEAYWLLQGVSLPG